MLPVKELVQLHLAETWDDFVVSSITCPLPGGYRWIGPWPKTPALLGWHQDKPVVSSTQCPLPAQQVFPPGIWFDFSASSCEAQPNVHFRISPQELKQYHSHKVCQKACYSIQPRQGLWDQPQGRLLLCGPFIDLGQHLELHPEGISGRFAIIGRRPRLLSTRWTVQGHHWCSWWQGVVCWSRTCMGENSGAVDHKELLYVKPLVFPINSPLKTSRLALTSLNSFSRSSLNWVSTLTLLCSNSDLS